jgi:RimJ/RimL family protein N-acetyltransferase
VEIIEFETARLKLRQWRAADRDPFAALNADPEVMEYFPAPQARASSDATIDMWQGQFAAQGWSNWAAELIDSGEFIGFVGLTVPRRVLPFSPCVEIGWRLACGDGAHRHAQREPGLRTPRASRGARVAPPLPLQDQPFPMG